MSSDSDIAIRVDGVGKRYVRGHVTGGLLSERLNRALLAPVRRLTGNAGAPLPPTHDSERFWAVRGVSFDVRFGEAVGIIGRNGSGKSTLLKLLSRITLPTEGRIELYGRTTSLLEVGTGFHQELTGRENIFLNGSLLGLSRWEIFERYDEIVEFAGIGPFIDTPVKRYSSGMFIRLAFSVAAHLEPEILIVDEVLAVGDMEFQRRCIEKMEAAASEGRTVVFVSHDMTAIERVCDRVLVLDGGRITASSHFGHPEEAIGKYVESMYPSDGAQEGAVQVPPDGPHFGTGEAKIVEVALRHPDGQPTNWLRYGQPFAIRVVYEWSEAVAGVAFEVGISRPDGHRIVTVQSIDGPGEAVDVAPGRQEVTVDLEGVHLLPGEYTIDAACHRMNGNTIEFVERVALFKAMNGRPGEDRYLWPRVRGYVRPDSSWRGHEAGMSATRTSRSAPH